MVTNYEIYLIGQFIFFITLIKLKNILTLIVAFLSLECKEFFVEAQLAQIQNHSKQTKNEKNMRLELETGLDVFLQKI